MADDKDARVHQEVATPPPPVTVGSIQQQAYSWNQNSQPIGQPVMNDQLKKMLQPKGKNKGSWSTPATKDIQKPGQPKAEWKQQSWTKSSDKSSWDKKSSWNSQDWKQKQNHGRIGKAKKKNQNNKNSQAHGRIYRHTMIKFQNQNQWANLQCILQRFHFPQVNH